jgi:hypothetical protein
MPSIITIGRADVLLFRASGGRVTAGTGLMQVIGPLITGVVVNNGQILSPGGAPNAILILAVKAGKAQLEIVTGDPFYMPVSISIEVIIE